MARFYYLFSSPKRVPLQHKFGPRPHLFKGFRLRGPLIPKNRVTRVQQDRHPLLVCHTRVETMNKLNNETDKHTFGAPRRNILGPTFPKKTTFPLWGAHKNIFHIPLFCTPKTAPDGSPRAFGPQVPNAKRLLTGPGLRAQKARGLLLPRGPGEELRILAGFRRGFPPRLRPTKRAGGLGGWGVRPPIPEGNWCPVVVEVVDLVSFRRESNMPIWMIGG